MGDAMAAPTVNTNHARMRRASSDEVRSICMHSIIVVKAGHKHIPTNGMPKRF